MSKFLSSYVYSLNRYIACVPGTEKWWLDGVERSLKDKLRNIANPMDLSLTSSCCIYKVPPKLRTINEKDYTPTFISIGPFYSRDPRLESMQDLKYWLVNQFLKMNPEKTLLDYIGAVDDWVDENRHCYSEMPRPLDEHDHYLVPMILTDVCFIIGFFMTYTMNQQFEDLSRLKPGITSNLMLDLILLENQLTFFVLERLFRLCSPTSNVSFLEITFNVFVSIFLKNMYPSDHQIFLKFSFTYFVKNHLTLPSGETLQVQHLCDLLRIFYVSGMEKRDLDTEMKRSYGVSQLKDAGIEFQADYSHSMIEVQCSEGRRLHMPSIKITDWTEIMLKNVVAFEQCQHPFMHYVTDYVIFLDCLINTEKDVEILVDKRIIQNWVANDKVAVMVSKLCHNVTARNINPRYTSIYQLLSKFYDNPYYKNKATFMSEHWSTPWKRLSLLGGILLLFLTLIQTICSMIPLFQKN